MVNINCQLKVVFRNGRSKFFTGGDSLNGNKVRNQLRNQLCNKDKMGCIVLTYGKCLVFIIRFCFQYHFTYLYQKISKLCNVTLKINETYLKLKLIFDFMIN